MIEKIKDPREIRKALKYNDEYIVGSIALVYAMKLELDENITILHSFARYYNNKCILTTAQISAARKILLKMPRKLSRLGGIQKLPVYNPDRLEIKVKKKPKRKIKQIKEVHGLKGKPKPFQWEGISFLEDRNGRVLLGDEMGLGKTFQAIAWLQHRIKDVTKTVIVVPATLKYNWEIEIEKFTRIKSVQILSGQRCDQPLTADVIIINYDIVMYWEKALLRYKPDCIIMDECQKIVNSATARTKATSKIARKCKHVIGLSGTPINNRAIEFYNIIKLIDKNIFPSKKEYKERFCDPRFDGMSWTYTGSSNTKELHQILTNSIMLRRKKEDVMKDLPKKTRIVIPIILENRKPYDDIEKEFDSWLEGKELGEQKVVNVLTKITALKKAVIECKLKQCISWIEDYLESGGKLVVFTTHTEPLLKLFKHFKNQSVMVNGSVSGVKRQACVESFQTDDNIRLFLGNLEACAEGLTLTAASATLTLELGWSSTKHDQAEARVDRIGQTASAVFAYYLIAKDTIEEDIALLQDGKRRDLGEMLDGKEVKSNKMLTSLMRNYKKRRLVI